MQMIQLMGVPSADRQAFGKLGGLETGSSEGSFSLGEFGIKLDAELSGGQETEVNIDELIAQMVGLDLLPGQLPNRDMEVKTEEIDLSWGGIGRAAERVARHEVGAFIESAIGEIREFGPVEQLATWLGNASPVPKYEVQGFTQIQMGGADSFHLEPGLLHIPDGETAVNAEITGVETEIPAGGESQEFRVDRRAAGFFDIQSDTSQNEALARETVAPAGQNIPSEAKVGFNGSGQGRREDDGSIGLQNRRGDRVEVPTGVAESRGEKQISPENLKRQLEALLKSGRISDPEILSRIQHALAALSDGNLADAQQALTIHTKKGTFQIGGDFQNAAQIKRGMTDEFGRIDQLNRGDFKSLPMTTELSNGNSVKFLADVTRFDSDLPKPMSAPAIIEGNRGRLTAESFLTKPMVTTQKFEEVKPLTAGTVTPTLDAGVAKAEMAEADLVGVPMERTKLGTPTQAFSGVAAVASASALAEEFEVDSTVAELDGSGEVTLDDFGIKTERAETLTAVKASPKTDEAVKEFREKLVSTVLDLVAAKSPRTVNVQLTPFELGTIDVSVRTLGRSIDVDMRASDDGVRNSLASQRGELVVAIESRGNTVSSMNVGQQPGHGMDQSGAQGQNRNSDTRQEFVQANNLGKFSNTAEAPVSGTPSYATVRSGQVDFAA